MDSKMFVYLTRAGRSTHVVHIKKEVYITKTWKLKHRSSKNSVEKNTAKLLKEKLTHKFDISSKAAVTAELLFYEKINCKK